ncbi:hypothetical protein SJPD1_2752 [Sulfurospirillum diekertiae]|uniref:Uncharacterized protein n=1 Tax=Sulfurospirillum diekertiae TaxID=1854492 RepID=A0A290HHZ1_9BACT|nr:hypothetical protein [Sulfurospirillum diekertiae]ATB70841.1 hypothetical protein SJPD1_2752 [Sulfurospirillum diekertiae]
MAVLKILLKIILRILIFFIIVFISIFVLFFFSGDNTSSMCGSDIIEQSSSPTRNLKAVVFQYDCGATTSFTTKVAIVSANSDVYDQTIIKNLVFSADSNHDNRVPLNTLNGGPDVRVQWLANGELEIQYPSLARVHLAKSFLFFKWLKIKFTTFE